MSALPQLRWTLDAAPAKATTLNMRRTWAKISSLAYNLYQGDEREALAIGNAALHEQFWKDDDFLVGAWNKFFARYSSDQANNVSDADDDEEMEAPVEPDDGLDEMQRILARDARARELLSEAYEAYTPEPEPVIAIVTDRAAANFDPVKLRLVERHDTAAERHVQLYEDHTNHLTKMQRIYDELDAALSTAYLTGK